MYSFINYNSGLAIPQFLNLLGPLGPPVLNLPASVAHYSWDHKASPVSLDLMWAVPLTSAKVAFHTSLVVCQHFFNEVSSPHLSTMVFPSPQDNIKCQKYWWHICGCLMRLSRLSHQWLPSWETIFILPSFEPFSPFDLVHQILERDRGLHPPFKSFVEMRILMA